MFQCRRDELGNKMEPSFAEWLIRLHELQIEINDLPQNEIIIHVFVMDFGGHDFSVSNDGDGIGGFSDKLLDAKQMVDGITDNPWYILVTLWNNEHPHWSSARHCEKAPQGGMDKLCFEKLRQVEVIKFNSCENEQ